MAPNSRLNSVPLSAACACRQRAGHVRPLAFALATASLLSLETVHAQGDLPAVLPAGLTVVHGQVKAATHGKQLTITNSDGSILNWKSFSIGAGHGVSFVQPSADSQVLNRVVGNDPSALLGTLSSNGRVWLLNPNGILFGQGARIDVASLVASTLNLNDVDWLAGRYRFNSDPQPAGIVNKGEIRSSFGGHVALLGGAVRNEGLIDASGGQLLLAAGRSIELVDTGAPNLRVRISAPEGEALNLGTLAAAGGRIDVHASVVNQNGIVRADSLGSNAAGDIVLTATRSLELSSGSTTSASGARGGSVHLDSGSDGTTLLGGTLAATGSAGLGGQVTLLGSRVGLMNGARVDASGTRGGGAVMVGGGERGQDPMLRNSQAVFVGADAHIRADSTGSGDGGRIVLWADQTTRAYGSFSARAGAAGGNGGFIETSGNWVDIAPTQVDVSAANGRAGIWLIDPYDITISDAFATRGIERNGVDFTSAANSSRIAPSEIRAALNSGSSVVITTGTGGTQAGDINVTGANLTVSPQAPVSLTLRAARNINITSSTIGSTSSPLSIGLTAGTGGAGGRATLLNSSVTTAGGSFQATGTGTDITAYPDELGVIHVTGVLLSGAQLNAGGGRVQLSGNAVSGNPFAVEGVGVSGSTILAGEVEITGQAQGTAGSASVVGTLVRTSQVSATRSMKLTGTSPVEGVALIENSRLDVSPATVDRTALLEITGNNTAGGRSVGIAAAIGLRNGASLSISGLGSRETRGIDFAGIVDSQGGGDVRFATPQGSINLVGTRISTGGGLSLLGQGVTLGNSTALTSTAAGNAITVGGADGTGATKTFVNAAGAGALITPNGRWLIYAATPSAVTAGGLVPSFRQFDAIRGVANPITPLSGNGLLFAEAPVVSVSGRVAGKIYDGLTNATLGSSTTLTVRGVSPVSGEFDPGQVSFDPSAAANFATRDAGVDKPVTLTPNALRFIGSDGIPVLGYRIASDLRGDIAPATLTYVANPATRFVGAPSPVFSGDVTGFVAGDTLGTATNGTLAFTSRTDATTPPGAYAIEGGGLTAANYRFVQAAGNASALTITNAPRQDAASGSTSALGQSIAMVRAPASGSSPESGRVLDALTALRDGASGTDPRFGSLPIQSMSQEELAALLAAREAFKKSLFADSIDRLKLDPALADVRACTSLDEVELGTCLITDALKRAAVSSPAASAAPGTAPAAATPAAAAPAPAAPAATPTPTQAKPPVLAAARRAVRTAALPQIERKIAVVIGVDRYTDRSIPPLDNAVRDARTIGRLLESSLGYETVVLEDATKASVVRTLNRLAIELGPRDSVVIYYAGHGELIESTGQGYWQLSDSEAKKPETWLSNADISRLVSQIGASQVALISDSCYSGSLVNERIRATAGQVDPISLLNRKTVVVMSSGGNEPVFDEGKNGHSPFAYSLMTALRDVASWQVGSNVFERVRFAVARELPQRPRYGSASAAGHQPGGDYLFEQRQLDTSP